MRWPLVRILWLDAADPEGSWHPIDDCAKLGDLDCVSVGWLIAEDRETVTLSAHIAWPEEDAPLGAGVIAIPKGAILKRQVLERASHCGLRASFGVRAN